MEEVYILSNIPSQITYLLTAIGSLAALIVTLLLYIKTIHKKYINDQNENVLKVTGAMVDTAKANEHLANAIDDLKILVLNGNGKKK